MKLICINIDMIANFDKKRNRESFDDQMVFKVVGIIFVVIILVLILADFKIYQKKRQLSLQIEAYQEQIEDIKKSSQTLKVEISNSDNVDYLEKLGYEQFDQTKPGETEYMFIGDLDKDETVSEKGNPWTDWITGFWAWIKSKF